MRNTTRSILVPLARIGGLRLLRYTGVQFVAMVAGVLPGTRHAALRMLSFATILSTVAACTADSQGPEGESLDWLGRGDTETTWALDQDRDGVPNVSDPCPASPSDAASSNLAGCAVIDLTGLPHLLLEPITASVLAVQGALADLDAPDAAVRFASGAQRSFIRGIEQVRSGSICAGADSLRASADQLSSTVSVLANHIRTLRRAQVPPSDSPPGDVTAAGIHIIDLDTRHQQSNYAAGRVLMLADELAMTCQLARPLADAGPVRGRVVSIDWANRQADIEPHGTFRIPDTFEFDVGLHDRIEVDIDGLGFPDRTGVLLSARPVGVLEIPIEPQTLRCLQLRFLPLQRLPPYSVRPLIMHDPRAYRAGDTYNIELGMALAAESICDRRVEATFAKYTMRLELSYTNAFDIRKAVVLATDLQADHLPVRLPMDMKPGELADLVMTVGYYGCRPAGMATSCSTQREVLYEETYALDVSAAAGRCVLTYANTEIAIDDRFSAWNAFQTTRVTDFLLLHVWDEDGEPEFKGEGYAAWQRSGAWQTSYPQVWEIVQNQSFAVRNTDFAAIHARNPGAFSELLATGARRAAGLRWPRVTGRNNGAEFRFACTPPNLVRDVVDFCPGGNAFYRFPFDASEERYQQGQGANGTPSHMGRYAYDMNAPEGIDILAARAGIVEAVRESSYLSSIDDSVRCAAVGADACRDNYVTIRHQDGSRAAYVHMVQNGVFVDVGEVVRRGQRIAVVGNVGSSDAPHLHFETCSPPVDASVFAICQNNSLLPRWQARDPEDEDRIEHCYELPDAQGDNIDIRSTNERWP